MTTTFRGDDSAPPRPLRIGYYVHHHGNGHATRAGVLGQVLAERGHEVHYAGSGGLPDGQGTVLPPDAEGAHFPDADAHGRLHFAPLTPSYRTFSTAVAEWVQHTRPDVVVVDVSVEVTTLVRTLGVPVVVVAQPGDRTDVPHQLAYDLAEAILAPWPEGFSAAAALRQRYATVREVGGISRFADVSRPRERTRAVPASPPHSGGDHRVRVGLLAGGPGWDNPSAVAELTATDRYRFVYARDGVAELLQTVDVVIAHAGQNAIADIACHRVPAVVVPQRRPFHEQERMAQALAADGFAATCPLGASAQQIRAVVDRVVESAHLPNGTPHMAWDGWQTDGAAERAADVIEHAAAAGANGRKHLS